MSGGKAKKKLLSIFASRSTSEYEPNDNPADALSKTGGRGERVPRRLKRPNPSAPSSRKPAAATHSRPETPETPPPLYLPTWPPPGLDVGSVMTQGKAMEFVATGTPIFKGIRKAVPHTSDEFYALYATVQGNHYGTDVEQPYTVAFDACSLRLQGTGPAKEPWEALEQPSLAFRYGKLPGTVTLNYWVGMSGKLHPAIELRESGVKPREVGLDIILERLIYLERGFEDEYEDLMYKNLYKKLLHDPEKFISPHKGKEKQIADLITVLSRHEWIDFSKLENQVVAKFFANAMYTDNGKYKRFFHQLLLSMELELRIQSKEHSEDAIEKLVSQLPPWIKWDLAVAKKWKDCMSIEEFDTGTERAQIRFNLNVKKAQVKALRKFARAMKWPNLVRVDETLKERDPAAKRLEDRSSDAMSYFTGMILPGPTLPWLLMNTLIDCDDDPGANALAALTHMHPNAGFQYKSTTYWSSTSIVGKVLAPTCQEIGGWVGPVRPAPDLSRIQIARIRQRRPKQHLAISDVESMTVRSDPLGPPTPSNVYPTKEYSLVMPGLDDVVDTIRIEKLALKPIVTTPTTPSPGRPQRPQTYDAAVQFAIDGRSWPLRLSYDVSFVSAYPCAHGPHPLFFDYVYKAVKVDEILGIRDWGGINANPSVKTASFEGKAKTESEKEELDAREKVLAVEAFGVADNEVLARAWCSHWGLSAIVADVDKCCMACAIREAYAACLTVVILIGGTDSEDDL